MGQEMGKGNDITALPLLQQLLPACLVLLVKPLCYFKGPVYPLSCSSEPLCILTNQFARSVLSSVAWFELPF